MYVQIHFSIEGMVEDKFNEIKKPSNSIPDDYDYNDDLQTLYYPLRGNWFKKRSNIGNFGRFRLPKYSWVAKGLRERIKARRNKLANAKKYYSMYSIPELINRSY